MNQARAAPRTRRIQPSPDGSLNALQLQSDLIQVLPGLGCAGSMEEGPDRIQMRRVCMPCSAAGVVCLVLRASGQRESARKDRGTALSWPLPLAWQIGVYAVQEYIRIRCFV